MRDNHLIIHQHPPSTPGHLRSGSSVKRPSRVFTAWLLLMIMKPSARPSKRLPFLPVPTANSRQTHCCMEFLRLISATLTALSSPCSPDHHVSPHMRSKVASLPPSQSAATCVRPIRPLTIFIEDGCRPADTRSPASLASKHFPRIRQKHHTTASNATSTYPSSLRVKKSSLLQSHSQLLQSPGACNPSTSQQQKAAR